MRFNGIDFGNVSNASGARNLVGQGYWYQNVTRVAFGTSWHGAGMIYKTSTLNPRNGNMDVRADRMTPREWVPKCIIVNHADRVALNAVGLTNPGLPYLLRLRRWQTWGSPATISFMTLGDTVEERIQETSAFVELLGSRLSEFCAPIKIELNISCPNTGHDQNELVKEAEMLILILKGLGVPVTVKLNVLTSHNAAVELSRYCDGLVMGNTIPWGQLSHLISWGSLFGSSISPLVHLDRRGGGLSGWVLRNLHCQWIAKARDHGIRIPIEGCGGVLSVEDAMCYADAGASGVQLGSISFLAPWNLRRVIEFANDPSAGWWK